MPFSPILHVASTFRSIMAVQSGPTPWPKMLLTGLSLGLTFGAFALAGHFDEAVLGTIFVSLLVFLDQGGRLVERLVVILCGTIACALAFWLGTLTGGHPGLILGITFALGLAAGLIHGWVPGFEMVPRQALICFVVSAYLPVMGSATIVAGAGGTAILLALVILDGILHPGRNAPRFQEVRRGLTLPGYRFGLIFGAIVAIALLLAEALGAERGYWIAITALVVMQRDPRASYHRALQRVIGTLEGVIIAFVIVSLLPHHAGNIGILSLILALPFLWPLAFARNYALGITVLSTWVLMVIDLALPQPSDVMPLLFARLGDTVLGCALAMLGTVLAVKLRRTPPPLPDTRAE